MFTSLVSTRMLRTLGLGRELIRSIMSYLEPPAIGLSPIRLKLLVKDPNNLVSIRMMSTLFARMARTDGVEANPELANTTRDALAMAVSTINKIRYCSDPCLSLRNSAANNVLFVTSWALSENLMMIVTGEEPPADPHSQMGIFQDQERRVAFTGLATCAMAAFVSPHRSHDLQLDVTPGMAHFHVLDVVPASMETTNTKTSKGAYQPPPKDLHLLVSSPDAVLSKNYPLVVVQGSAAIKEMKTLLKNAGAVLLGFDLDLLFALCGTTKTQATFTNTDAWDPFLCLHDGTLTVMLGVASAANNVRCPSSFDTAGSRVSTHSMLNVCRVMQGLQPIAIESGVTMMCEMANAKNANHVLDALQIRGNATFVHPSVKGGKNGGRATTASHGPQLGNGGAKGGKATIASHGPQLGNCGKSTAKAGKSKHPTNGSATCGSCKTTGLTVIFKKDSKMRMRCLNGVKIGRGQWVAMSHKCVSNTKTTALSKCINHVGPQTAEPKRKREGSCSNASAKKPFFPIFSIGRR